MIFRHIFDIFKVYHQKDNNFLHKNELSLKNYQWFSGFKNFFTLVAVTPDQDLEGCHIVNVWLEWMMNRMEKLGEGCIIYLLIKKEREWCFAGQISKITYSKLTFPLFYRRGNQNFPKCWLSDFKASTWQDHSNKTKFRELMNNIWYNILTTEAQPKAHGEACLNAILSVLSGEINVLLITPPPIGPNFLAFLTMILPKWRTGKYFQRFCARTTPFLGHFWLHQVHPCLLVILEFIWVTLFSDLVFYGRHLENNMPMSPKLLRKLTKKPRLTNFAAPQGLPLFLQQYIFGTGI